MSGIGKIAFEHLKFNHANNHDNIVTIFFRYSENQKNSRQKLLLRTKVITFLRKCAFWALAYFEEVGHSTKCCHLVTINFFLGQFF